MLKWLWLLALPVGALSTQETTGPPFSVDTLGRSPWGAVGRSLVVPGWGQVYNGSWWKVPLFVAGDVSTMWIYRIKDRKVTRIEKSRNQIDRQLQSDPFLTPDQRNVLRSRFNNLTTNLDGALNDRNLYGWLFALSHLLGMVDAYVDAHLFEFETKMDVAFAGSPGYSRAIIRFQW